MRPLPDLMNGAEPLFIRGGETGCLVLHGFMASPGEVMWLGRYLGQKGHTVYAPRLTGHGYRAEDMSRMRWEDWYGQALDGYHILRQQCAKVAVVGHSMGGLLSLLLASAHPVDALAVCATPIKAPSPLLPWAWLIAYVLPYTYHPNEAALHNSIVQEQERRGEAVIGRVHYAKWSSRAVAQFHRLLRATRERLPAVTAPLLLLYANNDETAPAGHMHIIAEAVASECIEKRLLAAGAHIVFQDAGREEAFKVVADFVAQV